MQAYVTAQYSISPPHTAPAALVAREYRDDALVAREYRDDALVAREDRCDALVP